MKAEVNGRPETGQIWATGSQKFALMKGISESLAGRLIPLDFDLSTHGLLREVNQAPNGSFDSNSASSFSISLSSSARFIDSPLRAYRDPTVSGLAAPAFFLFSEFPVLASAV